MTKPPVDLAAALLESVRAAKEGRNVTFVRTAEQELAGVSERPSTCVPSDRRRQALAELMEREHVWERIDGLKYAIEVLEDCGDWPDTYGDAVEVLRERLAAYEQRAASFR